jgi:hypothetical protein
VSVPEPQREVIAQPDAVPPKVEPPTMKRLDLAFLGVGLVVLVWVVSRYPLAELGGACLRMGGQVSLTLLVALGWHVCNSVGMSELFEGRVKLRTLIWVRLAAEGYNSLIIGVGGEPFRIRALSRVAPSDRVVATVIRDKLLGYTTGYFLSAGFIAYGVVHYALPAAMRTSLATYAVIVAVASIAGTALVVTRLPGRVGAVALKMFGGVAAAPEPLTARMFWRALPWYFAGRVLGVVEIALMLHLLGLGHDLWRAGFIDGVLNAAGTIGFLVPQGIGVFEGTSAYLFKTFGFAGSAGVVFALVRRARMLVMSLGGVVLHWLGRDWRG